MEDSFTSAAAIVGAFVALALLLGLFARRTLRWVRRRSKGAIAAGAALIGLGIAPDPNIAQQLERNRIAQLEDEEEDASGDPPTTS